MALDDDYKIKMLVLRSLNQGGLETMDYSLNPVVLKPFNNSNTKLYGGDIDLIDYNLEGN